MMIGALQANPFTTIELSATVSLSPASCFAYPYPGLHPQQRSSFHIVEEGQRATHAWHHALLADRHPYLENSGQGSDTVHYRSFADPAPEALLHHGPNLLVTPGIPQTGLSQTRLLTLIHQLRPSRLRGTTARVVGDHVTLVGEEPLPSPNITPTDRAQALNALINNPYEACYAIEPGPREIEGPVQQILPEEQSALLDEAMLFYSYLRGNEALGIEQSYAKAADLLFTSRDRDHVRAILECEVGGERLIPDGLMDYYWPHLLAHTAELGLACYFLTAMLKDVDLPLAAAWLVNMLERMPNPSDNRVQRTAQILNGLVEQGQNALVNDCFAIAYQLTHTSLMPGRDMTLINAHALLFIAYGEARYIDPAGAKPDQTGEFVTCRIRRDTVYRPVDDHRESVIARLFQDKQTTAFTDHVLPHQRKYFTQKAREALGTLLHESRSYAHIQTLKRLMAHAEQYEQDPQSRFELQRIMRTDTLTLGLKIVFVGNRFILGHPVENGNLESQLQAEQAVMLDGQSPLTQAVSQHADMAQDVRFGYINQIRQKLQNNDPTLARTLLFHAYGDPKKAIDRVAIALTPEELSQLFTACSPQRLAQFLMNALGIIEGQPYATTDQQAMTDRLKIIMPAIALMPLQKEDKRGLTLENLLTHLLKGRNGLALGMTLLTGQLYMGSEGSRRLEEAYEHVRDTEPWYDLYRVIVSGRLKPDGQAGLRKGSQLEDRVLVLLDRIMDITTELGKTGRAEALDTQALPRKDWMKTIAQLHTLLRKENVPLELKELCAKIIIDHLASLHSLDAEVFGEGLRYPWITGIPDGTQLSPAHHEFKHILIQISSGFANILDELTDIYDDELSLWVDFFAPTTPEATTFIQDKFNILTGKSTPWKKDEQPKLWTGSQEAVAAFDALVAMVNRHDQNSWYALQALLASINSANIDESFIRTRIGLIDLSGMIVRGLSFSLLYGITIQLAQQIYDGHGSLEHTNLRNLNMGQLHAPYAVYQGKGLLQGTTWRGADLSHVRFVGPEVLKGADLRGAKLPQNMAGMDLCEARIGRAEFKYILSLAINERPHLAHVNLQDADLSDLDLSGLDLTGANLTGVTLQKHARYGLYETRLTEAQLPDVLTDVSFEGAYVDVNQFVLIKQRGGLYRGAVITSNSLSQRALSEIYDLRGAKLQEDMPGLSFVGMWLDTAQVDWIVNQHGVLRGAKLEGVDLREMPHLDSKLEGADLKGAILPYHMAGMSLFGCLLDRKEILWVVSHGGSLHGVNLSGLDLTGIKLPEDTDLTHADLRKTNLTNATIPGAYLDHAILDGACLDGADLSECDFGAHTDRIESARARGTCFDRAYMYYVNLEGIDITGASFHGTMVHPDVIRRIRNAGNPCEGMNSRQHLITKADGKSKPTYENRRSGRATST